MQYGIIIVADLQSCPDTTGGQTATPPADREIYQIAPVNIPSIRQRLFLLSAAFLFLFSLILTISPAVRERSWSVDYRWSHWIGFFVWMLLLWVAQRQLLIRLPDHDPIIFFTAYLLCGWGLLTIWRLDPYYGARQTIWLAVATSIFCLILNLLPDLSFFRRYKYLTMLGGIILTALTLVLGTNPSGFGPRLWIGGADVYLQPSEPLKLLLVLFLAAYLADRVTEQAPDIQGRQSILQKISLPLIIPTIIVTGFSVVILFVQRDLGTASIFLVLYTVILYLATGKKRILIATALILTISALIGYYLIDIIHSRLDVWLNPWTDPSGKSYQVIQSLLAIANGGIFGRGPGLGSPSLVPVAISDFIYTSVVEETGLVGAIGILTMIGALLARGLRTALLAPDRYQRLLAGGLSAYVGVQSLLILGGNLRLLPLTGVTLPFVSYGGSSLVTAVIALTIILRISAQQDSEPSIVSFPQPYIFIASLFALGIFAVSLATGWWAVIRSPNLLSRTDNARRSIADRYVPRGSLFDRENQVINNTILSNDTYVRNYQYTGLAPITGYTHPVYGQAGLESSLDGYLRGNQGNASSLVWWHYLLYGTPPPGLDVRLSINLDLQKKSDELMGIHTGALILINSQSGEILSMSSHPTYDQNLLDEFGHQLQTDPAAPLLNRAAQGAYPLGSLLAPFLNEYFGTTDNPDEELAAAYFELLGLYTAPDLRLPVGIPSKYGEVENIHVSPLQTVLVFSALNNKGIRPAARIALAVKTPTQGWVILPATSEPRNLIEKEVAEKLAESLRAADQPYWQYSSIVKSEEGKTYSWLAMGTLPNWQGTPLTLLVVLEENNIDLATAIGKTLLIYALEP